MRRLILKMSVSLDGFVGGPSGEVDWALRTLDETAMAWLTDMLWQAGAHIMGSRTFADMAAYWPSSMEPVAAPMNQIPKVVFSRSRRAGGPQRWATTKALEDASSRARAEAARGAASWDAASWDAASWDAASWDAAEIATGELAREVLRLKSEPGKDIVAHGGASFARSLVAADLVDEYCLVVHPVALGRGLALFSELSRPLALTRVSSTSFPSGACAHVLRPA